MAYDAVSVHRDRMLSIDCFVKAVEHSLEDGAAAPDAAHSLNFFSGLAELPTFSEAASFHVMEAMVRVGGNQTLAGITFRYACPPRDTPRRSAFVTLFQQVSFAMDSGIICAVVSLWCKARNSGAEREAFRAAIQAKS
jgi:hypothetical protein